MKLKFVVSLVGLAFLFGAAAQAQERQVIDVGVTYSHVRYNPATSGIMSFSIQRRQRFGGRQLQELAQRSRRYRWLQQAQRSR